MNWRVFQSEVRTLKGGKIQESALGVRSYITLRGTLGDYWGAGMGPGPRHFAPIFDDGTPLDQNVGTTAALSLPAFHSLDAPTYWQHH